MKHQIPYRNENYNGFQKENASISINEYHKHSHRANMMRNKQVQKKLVYLNMLPLID